MRKMIYWILALIVLPFLVFAGLSCATKAPATGLVDGRLRPCPNKPNCVSSEAEGTPAYIEPLAFDGPPEEAWPRLKTAVQDIGGRVEEESDTYLRATFRSRVFRFVDDLECRLDAENRVIHGRSASRVGYSDLGVNRKRVERLRARFEQEAGEPGAANPEKD